MGCRLVVSVLGILLYLSSISGCGKTTSGGVDAQTDAAMRDAAVSLDASTVDAAGLDAGTVQMDAGALDTGVSEDAAPDAGPTAPCAELVYEQLGDVLTVVDGASVWSVSPLAPGQGFTCMRVEFEMQTADTLQTIIDMGGCPIFLSVAGIAGPSKILAGSLFKMHRAQTRCPPGPHRLELDTWVDADVLQGPWSLGQTYHVVLEVVPFTSSVTLYQNGQQIGPTVSASITGTTVPDTVDPVVTFGLDHPMTNAYWPNYDAVYRDVRIWADRATP